MIAALRGEIDSIQGLIYKGKAIKLINDDLKDPQKRYSEGMLTAISSAGWFEYRWGSMEAFEVHVNAWRCLLHGRGNVSSLQRNRRLVTTTSWAELATAQDQAVTLRESFDNFGGREERSKSNKL